MNSQHWLAYYQNNKNNRPEPKWNLPSPLEQRTQNILGHSLSHFQLGETGEGTFLLAQASAEAPDDVAYHEALRLFIAEEQEHARLLGRLVRRFGGTSVTISAPEVPSALDRGVVDGIFTAGVGAVLWKDLLKYGYLIPVNWNNSYILANAEAFNKLSPDLQTKLRKAAQDAAKWNQDTMQTEEAASVKVLTDAGYVMTTAPAEEAAKVADTMKPYWDDWAKSRGPMVVEALGKVRAALGR